MDRLCTWGPCEVRNLLTALHEAFSNTPADSPRNKWYFTSVFCTKWAPHNQIFWRTLKLRLLHKQVDPVYNFQYAYFKAYSNRVPLAVFVNLFTCIVRVLNVFLIKAGIIFMVILEQTSYCCEKRNLIWDWFALQVIWWNFNFSNVMD